MFIIDKEDISTIAFKLTLKEFRCKCGASACRATIINKEFIKCWVRFRKLVNLTCFVNSGFRCAFNNFIHGAKSRSKHQLGMAIDISTDNLLMFYTKDELINFAKASGFTYWYFGVNFMHLDCYQR